MPGGATGGGVGAMWAEGYWAGVEPKERWD